jgi:ADP-ribosylglycohydrolase
MAGQPTDDSELALALARSIIKKDQYSEEEAATAYAQWYDSHPFDIGNTTRLALSAASNALHRGNPAAPAAQVHASHSSQANGALMRVSPLAIYGATLQPYEIARFARTDAGITHPNEVCRAANAVFAVAISYAIRMGYNAHLVYKYAWSWAHDNAVDPAVLESLEAAEFAAPLDFMTNQGWVLVAFQNAFYQLRHAPTLEEGVIETVRCGGDTDTNAAIAGALLGAVHGRGGIPAQWMDRVLTCRPVKGLQGVLKPRPATYWPVDALALSERLLLAGLHTSYRSEFPVTAEYQNGDEWKDRTCKFKPLGHVPSAADLDVVLGFIPLLEKNPIESLYRWERHGVDEEGVLAIARPVRDWKIDEFIWCLINHGWVQDFDWNAWAEEGKRYEQTPELVDGADLATCIKLLTAYQRADRFCDGLLAHMIESGQIARILRRLGTLRDMGAIPEMQS